MRGSTWKEETQLFERNFLSEIIKLKNELENRAYKTSPTSEFAIHERGKIRCIHGSRMRDRVVRHSFCDNILTPKLDEFERWLLDEILQSFRIDVSYMSDPEYVRCMDEKFNSVEYYQNIPPSQRTGKQYMEKSVDIGDQTSQNIGTYLPTKIDNLAKIVHGVKRYGRYMDDIYIIGRTREEVRAVMEGIIREAEEMGLYINNKKTHIAKLSKPFKYLQIRYYLTDSGRVVRRINPKSVTRERRKLKAYKRLMNRGEMPYERIEQSYKSWMGANVRMMSKKQIKGMKALYEQLFERSPRWKK